MHPSVQENKCRPRSPLLSCHIPPSFSLTHFRLALARGLNGRSVNFRAFLPFPPFLCAIATPTTPPLSSPTPIFFHFLPWLTNCTFFA
jgi:hypothetical protein